MFWKTNLQYKAKMLWCSSSILWCSGVFCPLFGQSFSSSLFVLHLLCSSTTGGHRKRRPCAKADHNSMPEQGGIESEAILESVAWRPPCRDDCREAMPEHWNRQSQGCSRSSAWNVCTMICLAAGFSQELARVQWAQHRVLEFWHQPFLECSGCASSRLPAFVPLPHSNLRWVLEQ